MRRFSQRSHLVTLSEINITPLLDLAFVLLIIFVITTPLLEQSIELKLPQGRPDGKTNQQVRHPTVEISNTGYYALEPANGCNCRRLIARLAQRYHARIRTWSFISAPTRTAVWISLAQLLDGCQKNGITRYSLRTDPTPN